MACNRKIGTSRSLVGAVYDRPQSREDDIVGGHRPPLQKTAWSRFICYRPLAWLNFCDGDKLIPWTVLVLSLSVSSFKVVFCRAVL